MTKLKSYFGSRLIAEYICPDDQSRAIEKFRKMYPEQRDCEVIAERADIDEEALRVYFRTQCVL